ncbi:MAG: T9SS type A sorting domain-containing protein [Bacteroidia bacterium]|nr:T9SS type A sorting domain-containing protein [Bacteroidia bacterium]
MSGRLAWLAGCFALILAGTFFSNNLNAQTYCTTGLYSTGCTFGDMIDNISISTLNQTSTGCTGGTGIADYTSISVPFTPGNSYPYTITSQYSSSQNAAWWIDFNNDGDFDDSGEFLGSASGGLTISGSVTIPSGAASGNHRMRARVIYSSTPTAGSSCTSYSFGEAHDYTAVVTGITPTYCTSGLYTTGCTFGDMIDNISISTLNQTGTGCTGGTGIADYTSISVPFTQGTNYPFTVTSQYSSSQNVGWWIDFNDNGDFGDAGEFLGNTSGGLTMSGSISIPSGAATGNHRMRVRVVYANSQSSGSSCTSFTFGETHDYTASISGVSTPTYCTPTYSFGCSSADYINNFSTTGGSTNISNLNSGCNGNTNNYIYYSTSTVTQTAGGSFNFSVQSGSSWGQGFHIWVDWDNDGSFTGPGEDVWNSGSSSTSAFSGSITVPSGTSPGLKRMRVRCAYGTVPTDPCGNNSFGETEDYNVSVGSVTQNYCTPTYSFACSSADYINNFSTTGGSTNISNLNSGCNGNTNNYIYYSTSTVTQTAGSSFSFTVQSGSSWGQGFHIWVDWDNDGSFTGPGEDVWNSGSSSTSAFNGTITIPSGTTPGLKRMRVRCAYGTVPTDPCGNNSFGETEDYNVDVVSNTQNYCTPTYSNACSSADYINNFSTTGGSTNISNLNSGCNGNANNYIYYSTSTVTQIAGGSFSFTVQSGSSWAQGFRIWVDWDNDGSFTGPGEDVWNSGTSSTSAFSGTITVPTGTASGQKRMRVRCAYFTVPTDPCGNYSFGETEDYNLNVSAPVSYCTPSYTNACVSDDYINNFSTTGGSTNISNLNSGCNGNANNYIFYSSMAVTQIPGASFNFTVQSGSAWSQGFRIWVDWNNDGSFTGPGEDVWNSGSVSTAPFNGTITVPVGTSPGTKRMRVRCAYFVVPTDPCANYSYGETEDYNCVVGNPPSYCTSSLYGSSNCSFGDDIDDISISTLNQVGTGCTGGTGIADYTNITIPFDQGASYPFTITTNYSSSEYTGWWIDFNNNGDFGDPGEFIGNSGPSSGFTITGSVAIPAGAALGYHRMRVRLAWLNPQSLGTSCTQYTYGETHDYTAQILVPPTPCPEFILNAGCTPVSYSGNTVGTGNDCSFRASEENTFAINLPFNGTWDINTCGSAFDTYLYLSSSCCSGLIASNDDACGLQSRITYTGGPGTVYVSLEAFSTTGGGAYTLTVQEATPPTALCQDLTLNLSSTGSVVVTAGQVDAGSYDNCSIAGIFVTPPFVFDCSSIGTPQSVQLAVTDPSNNIGYCYSNVTVQDVTPPTAVCQDITINTSPSGQVTITGAQIDNSSTDNCSVASLAVSPNTFDCTNKGPNAVVLTVSDPYGNSSTCNAVVTVENVPLSGTATFSVYDCGYNVSCNGAGDGSIDYETAGGCDPHTYSWSGPGGFSASTQDIGNLSAGTYTVTTTDAANTTLIESFTLTEPDPIAITLNPSVFAGGYNVKCNGDNTGSIEVVISGGASCLDYSVALSGPVSGSQTSGSPQQYTGLSAGAYTVTVTDANGCVNTAGITLTEPPVLDVDAGVDRLVILNTPFLCPVVVALPSGGVGPYSYFWFRLPSLLPFQTGQAMVDCPTTTTTYVVRIKDANSCVAFDTVVVNVIPRSAVGNPDCDTLGFKFCFFETCTDTCLRTGNVIDTLASYTIQGNCLGECATCGPCANQGSKTEPANPGEEALGAEGASLGASFEAFPNPFNNKTTLRFNLPESGHAEMVVYDLRGEVIATPFKGEIQSGETYEVGFHPEGITDGIYMAKLVSPNGKVHYTKLILIR